MDGLRVACKRERVRRCNLTQERETPMRTYRNRPMLAIVDLFTAFTIVAMLASVQGFCQDCNQLDNGCARSKPVPCSNATCADTTFYPGGVTPQCGGVDAVKYTATSANWWYNCQTAQPPKGANCQDALDTCLNVNLFSAAPCNQANMCGSTTYKLCGYGSGPGC